MVRRLALGLAVFAFSASAAAQTPSPDPLAPLRGLIGRWQGTSDRQPGRATVEREYTPMFGSRFIQMRNRSTYAPQDKNAKGEVHEDLGVFSLDARRNRLVLRQFHTEGFVNQYILDAASQRLVFTTEAIENIASGWRARETYLILGPDEFEEVFELAEPGKDFELYSRARFKRAPGNNDADIPPF